MFIIYFSITALKVYICIEAIKHQFESDVLFLE